MLNPYVLLVCVPFALAPQSASKATLEYTLRVDSADLSGVAVELRVRNAPASLQLAAYAHPIYDDKYWRNLEDLTAFDPSGGALAVTRQDSMLWRVANSGDVIVRYRVRFPPEGPPRASWRPFLAPSGGLVGGPHSFLYVEGEERAPVTVTLELPDGWRVATGLPGESTARTFGAPDLLTLMESPMLVGTFREWRFQVGDIPHRVVYWPLPDATPFDTTAFAQDIQQLSAQAIELFGTAPYAEYTFLVQDGAFGALEHPNSVTLGAPSEELASDPHVTLPETAHEFFHTWNLMAIQPIEYRGVDYRVQPPVAGLWFSEGVTLFYADLLLRRAGLPARDSTRIAHLENLVERYVSAPGNARFSAEDVSRIASNDPTRALGDYTASTHLQGELIGTVLDLLVRDATDGTHSMDDVMRRMYARFLSRGFTGADVQAAVEEVCSCSAADVFDGYVRNAGAIDFDRYLAPLGLRLRTSWGPAMGNDGKPAPDLRAWGWEQEGEPYLRLRVADPNSVWGRAGLHTNDQIVSINGAPVRTWPELREILQGLGIGDSVEIVVQRPSGRFDARVVIEGFYRPTVSIESVASPSERQRRLLAAWVEAR
jgi:predicted metalloprotease with PDZ domain